MSDRQTRDTEAMHARRAYEKELDRIERPAPTEHCVSTAQHDGHEWAMRKGWPGTGYWCPGFDAAEEHPPTREQIADLIPLSLLDGRDPRKNVFEVADQILALIQNGADRG